jgi:hypothetical protein
MTNFEVLKAKLIFPVSDNAITLALLERGISISGITGEDTYSVSNKQAVDLAHADLIVNLIAAPNISEGGYSISLSDKQSLLKLAGSIYTKYGVANPLSSLKPTATFVNRW